MIDIGSVMMEMPLEMPTTTQPTEEDVPHKRVYYSVKQNIRNELKQKWIEHEESWSAEKYSQETGIKLRRVREFLSKFHKGESITVTTPNECAGSLSLDFCCRVYQCQLILYGVYIQEH